MRSTSQPGFIPAIALCAHAAAWLANIRAAALA